MWRALIALAALMHFAPAAAAQSAEWFSRCQAMGGATGMRFIPNLADPEKCKFDVDGPAAAPLGGVGGSPGTSGNPNPNANVYEDFLEALYSTHGVTETHMTDDGPLTVTTLPDGLFEDKFPAFQDYVQQHSLGLQGADSIFDDKSSVLQNHLQQYSPGLQGAIGGQFMGAISK